MTTVTINNRPYNVEVHPEGDILDPTRPSYTIRGPRAAYRTMRNAKTPNLMFLIREHGMGQGAMRDVWLSDKTDELRQVLVR